MAGSRKSVWPRLRGRSISYSLPVHAWLLSVFFLPFQSIAIGVSSSRKLFATACKATTAKHASVRVYETETFRPFGQPLEGHALTVTRIAFSPDDQLVLTVSRDRSWRLFRREESGPYFNIIHQNPQGGALTCSRRICTGRSGQVARSDNLGWGLGNRRESLRDRISRQDG